VLIGDVWLCSGQSNMLLYLKRDIHADTEIPKATDPQMRLYCVPLKTALDPQTTRPEPGSFARRKRPRIFPPPATILVTPCASI